MPKVPTAMQGVFKEMLEDYLKVVAKDGGRAAAREGGQAAGREAAQAALRHADEAVEVPFKLTKQMAQHKDELVRQLERQLKHFDGMTPDEILKAIDPDNLAKRTGVAQREARERFSRVMADRQRELVKQMHPDDVARQLKDFGVTPTGNPLRDMKNLAEARTDGFMKTVAALHEPDIVAGGLDQIGRHANDVDSFGLRDVNSSIGSQWKSVLPDLRRMLEGMDPDVPVRLTHPIR